MGQMTLLLLGPGLLCVLVPVFWQMYHPRKRGEPFGRVRIVMSIVAFFGAALLILNFILSLLD